MPPGRLLAVVCKREHRGCVGTYSPFGKPKNIVDIALSQPSFPGTDDGLCPVSHLQLGMFSFSGYFGFWFIVTNLQVKILSTDIVHSVKHQPLRY